MILHLLGMHKALSSIPSTRKKKEGQRILASMVMKDFKMNSFWIIQAISNDRCLFLLKIGLLYFHKDECSSCMHVCTHVRACCPWRSEEGTHIKDSCEPPYGF